METNPVQNFHPTMLDLQIQFSKGWGEVLPTVTVPPAMWQQFTNHVAGEALGLVGEDRAKWLQMAFDYGITRARGFQNPDLTA